MARLVKYCQPRVDVPEKKSFSSWLREMRARVIEWNVLVTELGKTFFEKGSEKINAMQQHDDCPPCTMQPDVDQQEDKGSIKVHFRY